MAFTEFVVPTLKTDPETEATFTAEIAPFLINILDTHATPPKVKYFGKILLENGNDVSGSFRLCVGLGTSFPFALPLSLSHAVIASVLLLSISPLTAFAENRV
jgi:hypothetical protein